MTIVLLVLNAVIILAGLALRFSWKHWAPKVIAYALDKKLIKYKTDLETEKDKQLAEYGKTITGFNKFLDKKWEVYPELFRSIIKLHSELSEWAPGQSYPDFDILTLEEFIDYLDTFGFSSPDKRDLIDKKQQGTVSTHDIYILLPQHFRLSIGETNNCFLEHRIFLSNDIDSLFEKFRANAIIIQSAYRHVTSYPNSRDEWDVIESKNEENGKLVEDLLCQMRSELEHSIYKTEIISE